MVRDPVDEFADLARAYCTLIEGHGEQSRGPFVHACRGALVRLYAAALLLPDVEPASSAPAERPDEEWSTLNRSLSSLLGEWNAYVEVFDPYKSDEPVHGMLSDDLSDIYLDLKGGLRWLESEDGPGKIWAVWDWRFRFHTHWGEHLTGALRPLHALLDQEWSASEAR